MKFARFSNRQESGEGFDDNGHEGLEGGASLLQLAKVVNSFSLQLLN